MNEWPPSDKIGNLPSEKISSNLSFSNLNDHLTSLITFEFDENYIQDAGVALINLLKYPFSSKEYNGKKDSRFNDVERVDIFRDETLRTVRCPVRFHNVLKYMETMKGRKPGIGLKYKKGTHHNHIHFIFEDLGEGWLYSDTKRNLNVKDIHKIEKIIDHTGLKKIIIIANKIGLPAKYEVSRINSQRGKIIEYLYYHTIFNHDLDDFL